MLKITVSSSGFDSDDMNRKIMDAFAKSAETKALEKLRAHGIHNVKVKATPKGNCDLTLTFSGGDTEEMKKAAEIFRSQK